VELLKQLKQQYRLILLSNTNTIHVEAFEQYIIETFGENILQTNFQTVYYSQEIGMRKPNREIYEFVLEQQGIHASEVIFFDDKEENLTEPKKSRWKTVLVDRDITELTPTVLKDL
jgi:putative hydrolase of the HAD superfamily